MRHPEPDVAPGICYGRTDLTLKSPPQADLSTLPPFRAIRSSPLRRARLLAQAIAQSAGLPLVVDDDLSEMDFGRWEGQSWSAIPRAEVDAWAEDFHHARPHGGESVAMVSERVRRALGQAEDGTLIVTHLGVIRAALVQSGQTDGWEASLSFSEMVEIPRAG